jgi:murein DD-endopeptidase MepM/ murein hydrolase activator NlpD
MAKRHFTFIVVHPDAAKTRSISVPHWFLCFSGIASLVGVITLTIFLVNFSRMSIKVLEFNRLRTELEGLKIENKMYHASTLHLGEKLWSLESLAQKLASSVGLKNEEERPSDVSAVTFPLKDLALALPIANVALPPELQQFSADAKHLESRFQKIDRYFIDKSTQRAHTPSIWPVWGLLWDRFGWRETISEVGEAEYHSGIDISTSYGTQVLASADGVVLSAERRSDYGNLVVLDHGSGLTTRYAHLSSFNVSDGQRVKKGEVIGFVGSTGRSTGPHLHYEVRLNDNPVNPLRYISKAPKG